MRLLTGCDALRAAMAAGAEEQYGEGDHRVKIGDW